LLAVSFNAQAEGMPNDGLSGRLLVFIDEVCAHEKELRPVSTAKDFT
jgi:hypothetical protein